MAKTFTLSQVLAGMEIDAPSASAQLTLNANVAGQSQVLGREQGKSRWSLLLGDTSPETGNNVGSNFRLDAYKDDGTFLSTPISINRQTGMVTIPNLGINDLSDIIIDGGNPGDVISTDGDGNLSWSSAGTVEEAPEDGKVYGRSNTSWTAIPNAIDAPSDGKALQDGENANWVVIPPLVFPMRRTMGSFMDARAMELVAFC